MNKFRNTVLAVCLSGALCFALAGCAAPFTVIRDAEQAARQSGRQSADLSSERRDHDDHYGRDGHDDDASPWGALGDLIGNELSGKLSDGLRKLSGIGEAVDQEESPNDHRQSFSYTGQKESALRITVQNASNIILRQSGGDDEYRFEYDPANFRVDTASKDGRLELSVVQLREPERKMGITTPNYKCYLTIPARAYDRLDIQDDDAGLCIDGLTSSFALDAKDCGFSISGCMGGMTIDANDCGLSVALPRDYAGGFTLSGKDLGFSLGFPDGEPENLLLRVDGRDNAIAAPSGWGQLGKQWEHKNGDGSARAEVSVSDSAGAISVGD